MLAHGTPSAAGVKRVRAGLHRDVVADPDIIRRSVRSATARLFSRWYSDIRHGRLAAGEIEWQRS
jgi:hypothetical protein